MIICFDLDGTLVNSEDWVMDAWKVAFRKNNLDLKEKKFIDNWGIDSKPLLKKILSSLDEEKRKKLNRDFHIQRVKSIKKVKLYKNAKKVLKELSKKYSLALVSNNSHSMINRILKESKIDKKLFKVIIGDDDVLKPKPFPNEIKKAERELGKKATFMIGDTKQDILAAKKAKIKSIIIKNAPIPKKQIKDADYIVKDIKDIVKIIEKHKPK